MRAKPFIPTHLKVRGADGSENFVETARVLRERDLQDSCLEKREFQRILKVLQKHKAKNRSDNHSF
jgi:hypothetical protein